jgi:hypothetical protein
VTQIVDTVAGLLPANRGQEMAQRLVDELGKAGYQIVPIHATPEMLAAAQREERLSWSREPEDDPTEDMYLALLAAAPK